MCISQNYLYKQHHATDYLQKPVNDLKSLVYLSKVSIYVNEHQKEKSSGHCSQTSQNA